MTVGARSARFEMRPLHPDEYTADQVRWLNDPETTRFMNARRRIHDSAGVREYVASHDNDTSFLLGIFDLRSGDYIGNHRIERDKYGRMCSLGALIGDKRYWGCGVLTETRAAVLDLVFRRFGDDRAWAAVVGRNVAVVASYQDLGFTCEGIMRGHRFMAGRRLDVVLFGMMRDEWIGHGSRSPEGEVTGRRVPPGADHRGGPGGP